MSILSGIKRFKDYLKTDNGYQLMSRQTTSDSVIFPNENGEYTDDNDTVQDRLGAIKGITDSITTEDKSIAISTKGVHDLIDNELEENIVKKFWNKSSSTLLYGGANNEVPLYPEASTHRLYLFDVIAYVNITLDSEKSENNIDDVWIPINIPQSLLTHGSRIRSGYNYSNGNAMVEIAVSNTSHTNIYLSAVYKNGSSVNIANSCKWFVEYVNYIFN